MRFNQERHLSHYPSDECPAKCSETWQPTTEVFERRAARYDDLFSRARIGLQRKMVWEALAEVFRVGDAVLLLNCRTKEDAAFLALLDVSVVARDLAEAINYASFAPGTRLDGAFLNLSGPHTVANLNQTAHQVAALVTAGAPVIVCFSNRFCLAETLWFLLHGRYRAAFSRLSGAAPVRRRDLSVNLCYPTLREVKRMFSPSFSMRSCIGLGIAVPSSYLEPVIRNYPRVLCLLRLIDRRVCHLPFLRVIGDHLLIHFERVEG